MAITFRAVLPLCSNTLNPIITLVLTDIIHERNKMAKMTLLRMQGYAAAARLGHFVTLTQRVGSLSRLGRAHQ